MVKKIVSYAVSHRVNILLLTFFLNSNVTLASNKCIDIFRNSSNTKVEKLSSRSLLEVYLNEKEWPYYSQLPNVPRISLFDNVLVDLMRSKHALDFYYAAINSRNQFNLFTENIEQRRLENRSALEQLQSPTNYLTQQEQQKIVDQFVLNEYFGFLHRPVNLYLIGEKDLATHLYSFHINSIYQKYGVSIDSAIEMLKGALDRSLSSNGLFFRGHSNNVEKYSQLKEGDEFTENGFLSTSISISNTYGKNVMFIILGKDAKFGLNTGEVAEAVFNKNSKFKVLKKYFFSATNSMFESLNKNTPIPTKLVLVLEQI